MIAPAGLRAALLIGLLGLAALTPVADAQQRLPAVAEARPERLGSLETLLANFDLMAFGTEGERMTWTAVQRWREPVRAVLIGDAADAYRDDVRALFADFAALTGVSFILTDGDSQANLRVFFSRRDWYQTAAARSFPRPNTVVCFTNTTVDSTGAIGLAYTVIPEDLTSTAVRSCLAHELMHAIGFQGHPMRAFDSALRNGIGTEHLTTNDLILIRALYDERLTANMTSDEALSQARDIVAGLLAKVQTAADPRQALSRLAPGRAWNGGPV